MSDALPLPPRARLEDYERHALNLFIASRAPEPDATLAWATGMLESLAGAMELDLSQPDVRELIDGGSRWLVRNWIQILDAKPDQSPALLGDAQFLLARAHGFESWPKLSGHLSALAAAEGSPFETAADAIISGDLDQLKTLLAANPELVRQRSGRDHNSTLLHYVSANGVEDFRQKTPPNIVEIARLLLDSGAEVDAESNAYRGRSTTFELAATSFHPENAGVQIELLSLLLERGAAIYGVRRDSTGNGGGSLINSCLANGRRLAAEFLAQRGARIDLEGASGLGNLDLMGAFFDDHGKLTPATSPRQMIDGFGWACEFGRIDAARFLLDRGLKVEVRVRPHGGTGLHWAAYEGHADLVALLLERNAPLGVKDDSFQGTPIDWAIHGWGHIAPATVAQRDHARAVGLLVRAGCEPDQGWLGNPQLQARLDADPRMRAALAGTLDLGNSGA